MFRLPRTEARRIHLIGPGSDTFALSLPSWRCRHQLTFRVFPDRRPTTPHRVIWATSMGFGCSPEPITTTGMRCRSTAHQPLLKFIYLGCPAFDLSENRPLPGVVSNALRPAPAKAPTRSALVVSHHLDGLLRFRARIYCNTMPNRVHCVSPPNLLSSKAETSSTGDSRIPTAQLTPLEESPSPAAVPCHHGRCHSCRLPTHQAFPRLLRCQVSQTPTKTPDDTSQNHMLKRTPL